MKVKNSIIESELNEIEQIEDDYKETILNLKNDYNSVIWKGVDKNSFDKVFAEHAKMADYGMINLESITEVFEEVKNKYKSVGNDIKCIQSAEKDIYLAFTSTEEVLEDLLKEYNSLDVSFDQTIKAIIDNEKKEISNHLDQLDIARSKIKQTFEKLRDMEVIINNKLSQINLIDIK